MAERQISSSSEELEVPVLEGQATLKTQASQATEAVAMLIVHPLRPMDPRTRLRDTTKDKRTCAPANERIDLNRTIKEHKVLIIEGSRLDVGLYLILDGAND